MKKVSCIRNGAIGFLLVSVLGVMPVSAQNTWTSPFTGNSFNNPMSATLDSSIMFSMQRRLTQSQLLGTLPSQRGRASNTNLFEQYQHGMPDRPMSTAPSYSSKPEYNNPNYRPAPTPASPPNSPSAPMSAAPPQHFPISASDFSGQQRVLPAVYAAKGPQENQAQLLQTFNGMMDAFEKEGRKNNVAYAIGFMIGVSAQVHTGKDISDTVMEKFIYDVNDILAGSPSFRALPAAKKQELYESSVLTGAMIGNLAKNPQTLADSKALAKQVLQGVGAIN
ncbi:MAG: DUF6683 family protein [bacterium]